MSAPSFPTPAQREILWTTLTILAILTLLAVTALVFFGFVKFLEWSYPILLPLGLAVMIALLLDPVVTFLIQKWRFGRILATLSAFVGSLILLALFLTLVMPPLIDQTSDYLKNDFPQNIRTAGNFINERLTTWPDARQWVNQNTGNWQNGIQQNAGQLLYQVLSPLGSIFGFIFGFAFVPIYVFYFLVDKESLTNNWSIYIPLRKDWGQDEIVSLISEINSSLVNYLRGQILVAICNGILTSIGLFAIGLPNYLFIGFIAGAFSIVPFLGIILSILPALLLALASSNGYSLWLKPLLVVIVFSLVQMSESLFVTPRVQSHSTGLHPLAIMIGIIFWSMILPGILGPIVAVPLTCTLVVIMRRYLWTREPVAVQPAALPVATAPEPTAEKG